MWIIPQTRLTFSSVWLKSVFSDSFEKSHKISLNFMQQEMDPQDDEGSAPHLSH